MRKPIHIRAPRPSLEERAKQLRIPKASERALQKLVEEFKAQLSRQDDKPENANEPEKRRKRASAA
ncbi:MAG: hypothetical protein WBE72_12770 [Terracidiphilus sp.]